MKKHYALHTLDNRTYKADYKMRETEVILSDIEHLVRSKGYIYSLCMLLLEDFHYDIEHLHEVDYEDLLGTQEIALLVGFLLHEPIDFSYPDHPTDLLKLKKRSFELIKELESSLLALNRNTIIEALEPIEDEKESEVSILKRLNFFVEDSSIIEPIIYSGNGTYLFQYAAFLENKYREDSAWLEQNVGFNISQALSIVEDVVSKLQRKFKRFYSFMIRAKDKDFDAFYNEPGAWQAHFYPYMNLFSDLGITKDSPEINDMNQEQWEEFYENLIGLFILTRDDFGSSEYVNKFLEVFTTDQVKEYNTQFTRQGDFNYYTEHPILLLEPGKYFIPLSLMLYKVLYELPDKWMFKDEAYRVQRLKNLAEYNNNMVFQKLSKVYFKENIYKNVTVRKENGEEAIIDILCVINDKALCIQTKSDMLSELSQRISNQDVIVELQQSLQKLYDDGVYQKALLLEPSAKLFTENGVPMSIDQPIEEVFTLGVTSGNFPTITHQAHTLINKKKGEPFPIYTTIFELEIMLYYLKSPFLLLYYLRQRTNLTHYFIATEELAYLGYHLCIGLHSTLDKEYVYIDDRYAQFVNRNYYPHKYGVDSWIKLENDPIENRWKNEYYDRILKLFKQSSDPDRLNIIFMLMDLRHKSVDRFTQIMQDLKEHARLDKEQVKNSVFITTDDFGICYIAHPNENQNELSKALNEYCQVEKYSNKARKWLGLGSYGRSYKPFDLFCYVNKPWEFNKEMEKKAKKKRFWFTLLDKYNKFKQKKEE